MSFLEHGVSIGTLIGVGIAAFSLIEGNRYRKRKDTMDYIQERFELMSEAQREAELFATTTELTESDFNEIYTDRERRGHIHRVLNLYEHVSVGVQHGLYDLAIINKIRGGRIIRNWHRLSAYVYAYRNEVKRDSPWCEFEMLVHKLSKLRSELELKNLEETATLSP